MSGDILDRIDATVAGRCPCGADPAPGSAWCSEDCRPVPGAGLGYAGERWTMDGPAMAVGVAEDHRGQWVEAGWTTDGADLNRLMVAPAGPRELQITNAGGLGAEPTWDREERVVATRDGSLRNPQIVEVFGDRAAVDGILSVLAGEPLEHWEARQVRDDRLVEGCEALLGQRLPEWMRPGTRRPRRLPGQEHRPWLILPETRDQVI